MKKLFISACGTDIGKTLVTTSLCWQLRAAGKKVAALKPVISGFDAGDARSDSALILQSCGIVPDAERIAAMSPWRYNAPLSPLQAAAQEGNPVELESLVQFCQNHAAKNADVLLVEGVGGVMAPLNEHHTVLDWMAALDWQVILVTGSYLGAVSHTLTAIETLKSRGIALHALVVSASADGVGPEETAAMLEKFVPARIPMLRIPRLTATQALWEHAPPLTGLCE